MKKRQDGAWYGKTREKAIPVAAVQADGPPTSGQRALSWRQGCCFNCGSPKHYVAECTGQCLNCRQPGHTYRQCLKPCPTCGGTLHSHPPCRRAAVAAAAAAVATPPPGPGPSPGPDRRPIAVIAGIVLPLQVQAQVDPTQPPHRVLLTRMLFQGQTEPFVVGLDTMAAVNVLPKSVARTLDVLSTKRPSNLQLLGVGKSNSEGVVTAVLRVDDQAPWEPTSFEVLQCELPPPVQVLLSFVWLARHQADMSLRLHQDSVSLVPCEVPSSTTA